MSLNDNKRRFIWPVSIAVSLLKFCISIALAAVPAAASDDVAVERDVMIPMRDGVLLATDIYRPAVDGAVLEGERPLLLTRTPYSKSRERDVRSAEYFGRHGYVVAVQDMRWR
jgi:predicted acyl esterase